MKKIKIVNQKMYNVRDLVDIVNANNETYSKCINELIQKNRTTSFVGVAALAFSIYMTHLYFKHDDKLYELSEQIKALKNEEGE